MNKTQKNILNAAFEVLAKDISAPLEKVAEHAGVTRMTLHRYYNGREALLEATGLEMIRLGNEIIDEAMAQSSDPFKQLESIIKNASQMGERFHFLMHAHEIIDSEAFDPLVKGMDDKMIHIFNQLREQKLIDSDVPNAWLLHLYGGVMTAAWSSLQEGAVAPRDIPKLAWKSFSQGVIGSS
ncbi:MAG: TetR/AcrR family transcriptional regulator [Anaerolineae bacterium]